MSDRLLAPLSGITLTIRATHSLHYTLPSSYMMIRSPRLCSHWSPPRTNGTTFSGSVSGPQFPHGLISSHVPAGPTRNVTGEAHSLSSYSAATSYLLLLSRLSYQSPLHAWTLLCRRLRPQLPLRMCPRRRLISLSPRYLLTWQSRRLSTVSTPHLWMLLCRRSHSAMDLLGPDGIPNVLSRINLAKMFCDFFFFSYVFFLFLFSFFHYYYYFSFFFCVFFFFLFFF